MPHQPVTLGDLSAAGKKLWAYCLDCQHNRFLDPASLPLPSDHAVPDVGHRLSCSRCGSQRIHSKPEWYMGKAASALGG